LSQLVPADPRSEQVLTFPDRLTRWGFDARASWGAGAGPCNTALPVREEQPLEQAVAAEVQAFLASFAGKHSGRHARHLKEVV
jgi:hypothetical protein